MTRGNLHVANPLPVFPNGLDGSQITRVENVFCRAGEIAFFQIVPRVAGADGDELQHAGIAVAVNHAARAAVADELGLVPFPDLAHRLFPKMAAIQVQLPVEVKILVPAETTELLLFAAQMPLHFRKRFVRIDDGESAVRLHRLDFAEQFDEFGFVEIDEAAVAETQVAARERRERIAERAAFEVERFEKRRQFFVVVNQPARCDAGGGLDADGVEKFVRAFDFFADVRQAAVFFVLGNVVRVNGHDDAAQAVAGEAAQVVVVP